MTHACDTKNNYEELFYQEMGKNQQSIRSDVAKTCKFLYCLKGSQHSSCFIPHANIFDIQS